MEILTGMLCALLKEIGEYGTQETLETFPNAPGRCKQHLVVRTDFSINRQIRVHLSSNSVSFEPLMFSTSAEFVHTRSIRFRLSGVPVVKVVLSVRRVSGSLGKVFPD